MMLSPSSATTTTTIPDAMRAVVVREHGGPEALLYETDFPVPRDLAEGQVLVRNDFAGLNFIDTYFRTGLYGEQLPFVAGQEGAGRVVKIHESVTDVEVGDAVAYSAPGTYCEYTTVPASKVVKIPNGVSMETALCCMVQGLTAHYLVTDAPTGLAEPGDWMLIFSAGSGTCQWAAQMAKVMGYKVIGTTSKGKVTEATERSCDHLIVLDVVEGKTYADYNSVDIVGKVMKLTNGEGVKCILDGVGKSTADISIQCLSRRGLWISFGNASGPAPPISLLRLAPKSGYVTRPKLNDYVSTKEELQYRADQVFKWVTSGAVHVKVDCIFPLKDAGEGHLYLEAGKSQGKVLYKIDS
jgi:NADPH:quinone reductase